MRTKTCIKTTLERHHMRTTAGELTTHDTMRRASDDSELTVGLRAEDDSSTGDTERSDAYVMLLHRRRPGKELCPLRLVDLFVGVEDASLPLDDHAPSFGDTMVISLEKHL